MRHFSLVIALLIIITFSGCQLMYVPNAQNVPQFEEQGEVKAHVGYRNFQLGYSYTENLGIVANGYYRKNKPTITIGGSEAILISKNTLIEFGTGYFDRFGEEDEGTMSVYGGLGTGKGEYSEKILDRNDNVEEFRQYTNGFTSAFLQGAVGKSLEKVSFAFSTRVKSLTFSGADTLNYPNARLKNNDIHQLDDQPFFFFEPALTLRFGGEIFETHGQLIYSNKLTSQSINYRSLVFNIGFIFNLHEIFN